MDKDTLSLGEPGVSFQGCGGRETSADGHLPCVGTKEQSREMCKPMSLWGLSLEGKIAGDIYLFSNVFLYQLDLGVISMEYLTSRKIKQSFLKGMLCFLQTHPAQGSPLPSLLLLALLGLLLVCALVLRGSPAPYLKTCSFAEHC